MIAHRAWRDIKRCRQKYGEGWKEYERQVPYLFIPVSHASINDDRPIDLIIGSMSYSRKE
jgi:delta24(24(1))-sterol reductase